MKRRSNSRKPALNPKNDSFNNPKAPADLSPLEVKEAKKIVDYKK